MKTKRNDEIRKMRDGGLTFQAIGDIYGLTRQRVQQIAVFNKNINKKKLSPTKEVDASID